MKKIEKSKLLFIILFTLIAWMFYLVSNSNASTTYNVNSNITAVLDNGVLTINGSGEMPDYTSSSKAPWNGQNITKIVINSGITKIGKQAFIEHDNLTTVSIPNTVKTIGEAAFYGNKNLKNITVPGSVTTISKGAFAECSNLADITLNNGITEIESYAFQNTALVTFTIPASLEEIGTDAFYNVETLKQFKVQSGSKNFWLYNEGLYQKSDKYTNVNFVKLPPASTVKDYKVQDGTTTIVQSAFIGTKNLRTVSIPESVYQIRAYAFKDSGIQSCKLKTSKYEVFTGQLFVNCPNLTNVTIEAEINDYFSGSILPGNTFFNCPKLTTVDLSNLKIKLINSNAFENLPALTTVKLPNNLGTIGYKAFINCPNLTNLSFPASLSEVSATAFVDCNKITKKYPENFTLNEDGYYRAKPISLHVTGTYDYDKSLEVINLVNQERKKSGASDLTYDEELSKAAMQRAAELSILFEHTRPTGMDALKILDKAMGENIAAGNRTPEAVINSWMNSSGHRENILRTGFKSIGVGCFVYNNIYYWVQLFSNKDSESQNKTNFSGTKTSTTLIDVNGSYIDLQASINTNRSDNTYIEDETYSVRAYFKNQGWERVTFTVDERDYECISSNTKVATISNKNVNIKSEGTSTITVKLSENKFVSNTINAKSGTEISYTTHVQNLGWQEYVKDGQMSGTSGKGLRLEGIKINIDSNVSGGIEYRTHVQNIGWQGYVSNNEMSGTSGKGLRLEAIQIKLTGELANKYDIYYRVHSENLGWLGWAKNDEQTGTSGFGYRLEAIEIKLVKKGETISNNGKVAFVKAPAQVKYTTHIQNIGWQAYVKNGEMSGTSGKGLRLEGIKIQLLNPDVSGNIEYATHVQNIGWQNFVKNGEMSGTSGKGLRLEAIRIRLTEEIEKKYDVYYRVHSQNFGWLGWAKNGENAGTQGYAYRLEGIEIKLVAKGSTAPGSTANAFRKK